MFCRNCGSQLPDNSKFCTKCGASTGVGGNTSQQQYTGNVQPQAQQATSNSQLQQEDNICAILGLIFAFIFPIAGLILSIIGMKKQQYHGLAVAGLVISIIAIVIYVIAVIAVVATAPHYPYYYYY